MISGLSTLINDHLAGGASRLAALLLPHMFPTCSVVAPCDPGAALRDLVLVQRGPATRRPSLERFVVLLVMLACARPASAHRLDEYLQATRLAIGVDRVEIELDLTAGAQIAGPIFDALDLNRDGDIDRNEAEAYARQVLESIALDVDGRRATVNLSGSDSPTYDDMMVGRGIMRVRATAAISAGTGNHRIVYANSHRPEMSVYLVNALTPTDRRIEIAAQQRDMLQRSLTLDYTVAPSTAWTGVSWASIALAMSAVLALRRRRSVSLPA
jgi:hypothetical protein